MLGWEVAYDVLAFLRLPGITVMRLLTERSPSVLYTEAARCYLEGHQACAWCGQCHCVFQTQRGARLEYSCNHCDFYVCHDLQTGQYHATPGSTMAARTS